MILQVGVKLLIKRDDKFLFIRRSKSFKPGPQKWDIPGGRIEAGERLGDALAREVKEETSLLVDSFNLLMAQDIFDPRKDIHVVRLTYVGTASGEVKISDEHDDYKWMSIEEISSEAYVDSRLGELIESMGEGLR